MKVLEFQAQRNPEDGNENWSWATLTAEQFLAAYADGDAIFDQLPAR